MSEAARERGPTPTWVNKITKHDMTPRARHVLRIGLNGLIQQYEAMAKKAQEKLGDEHLKAHAHQWTDYLRSLRQEFAEPGSAMEADRDQAHLFGDEGPFRKELNDMKGRP